MPNRGPYGPAYACPARAPASGSYPLDSRARISSAKAYYQRGNTAKCDGGKSRICEAAGKAGLMDPSHSGASKWRRWCG